MIFYLFLNVLFIFLETVTERENLAKMINMTRPTSKSDESSFFLELLPFNDHKSIMISKADKTFQLKHSCYQFLVLLPTILQT